MKSFRMNRQSKLSRIVSILSVITLTAVILGSASDRVTVVVIRENAVGSSAQAQPYLDKLLNLLAQKNGWQSVEGKYLNNREKGITYIEAERPHFGILSLATFLALRDHYKLNVVGQVALSVPGGSQYFIVSKAKKNLNDCKQQSLASDHLKDSTFVESIVAGKAFKLSDFKTIPTDRPIQTLKSIIRDEAVCALIDDAQLGELKTIQGGSEVTVVWKSQKLPPMPVVAFPIAEPAETKQFQNSMTTLCEAANSDLCKNVGIVSLSIASDSKYSEIISAYSKKNRSH
jgi:hypothetical protein